MKRTLNGFPNQCRILVFQARINLFEIFRRPIMLIRSQETLGLWICISPESFNNCVYHRH